MYTQKQFDNYLPKIEVGHTLDKLIEFAIHKDMETGNPDNLNRLAKAAKKNSRAVAKQVVEFVNSYTIFRVKDNGNFGVVKSRKAGDYGTAPLFSESVAKAEKEKAEKRKAQAAARKAKAEKDAQRPADDRLADAAAGAVAKILAEFGDITSADAVREAIHLAALKACKHSPQAIDGTEKRNLKGTAGEHPENQPGAVRTEAEAA